MKQLRKLGLVSVAMSLVALSACGGGGGGDDDVDSGLTIVDGGRRDTGAATDGTVNTPDSSTSGACNPVTNAGCTAPMKCGLDQNNAFACQAAGAGMQGTACTPTATDDGCAIGFVCLSTGKCSRFCAQGGPANQCPMEGTLTTACQIQLQTQGGQPIPGALVCAAITPCNPLNPGTACGAGQACYPAQTALSNLGGQCAPAGTKADGMACSAINECVAGSTCGGPTGMIACRKICNTQAGMAPMCTAPATCAALGGTAQANLGLCN